MKKILATSLLLVMLFMSVFSPVHAQGEFSAEELELIEYLQTAYANIQSYDSFQASMEQDMVQDMETFGMTVSQSILQNNSISVETDGEGNPSIIYMVLDQDIDSSVAGQSTQMSMQMEAYIFDGQYFLRFNDMPVEVAAMLPDDWTNAADLQLQGMNFGGLNVEGWASLSLYEISPETIVSITELPSEELDGVETRVFELEWSADQLLQIAGLEGVFSGMGGDMDSFIEDMLAGSVYSQKVWIDVENQIPLQIEVITTVVAEELELQGQTMSLIQDSTATVTYFGFNEPLNLEIPAEIAP
jgi:hypothetical protein